MEKIKNGDLVTFRYSGRLENGTLFDTTEGKSPFSCVIGSGILFPFFESKLVGMKKGEKKTFMIPFRHAYGDIRKNLIWDVSKERLPPGLQPHVGMKLKVHLKKSGRDRSVRIASLGKFAVTIDANHPLAGKDLYYEVEILTINS